MKERDGLAHPFVGAGNVALDVKDAGSGRGFDGGRRGLRRRGGRGGARAARRGGRKFSDGHNEEAVGIRAEIYEPLARKDGGVDPA